VPARRLFIAQDAVTITGGHTQPGMMPTAAAAERLVILPQVIVVIPDVQSAAEVTAPVIRLIAVFPGAAKLATIQA